MAARRGDRSIVGTLGTVAVLGLAAMAVDVGAALAQDAAPRPVAKRNVAQAAPARLPGAARPLTIRRRLARPLPGSVVADRGDYAPGLLRRWNDPNLYSFGGWRLGGDNFYGDGRGNPITRGNATLGAISGYGGARGGYGGPHFDSVGGFHPGPGPDAKEADDYASGSIGRPDYGGVVPHYPSLKQRVAALNAGIPMRMGPAPVTRVNLSAGEAPAYRASAPDSEGERSLRTDELPGLGFGEF